MTLNLRKEWFAYVAKVRKKAQRKQKKEISHRLAMTMAATSWPTEKVRIQNKARREERKQAKLTLSEVAKHEEEKPNEPAESQK